jgi:hypothetical protein
MSVFAAAPTGREPEIPWSMEDWVVLFIAVWSSSILFHNKAGLQFLVCAVVLGLQIMKILRAKLSNAAILRWLQLRPLNLYLVH